MGTAWTEDRQEEQGAEVTRALGAGTSGLENRPQLACGWGAAPTDLTG